MSRQDGHIAGVDTLVNSGPGSERWDLVILGDGFRDDELDLYRDEVNRLVDEIFATAPFDELRRAINVHRVDVVSRESGAGDLIRGIRRATYFDSVFGYNGLDRLLVADQRLALLSAIDVVPSMNATLVLVNSEEYGGSGGAVATFSRAEDASRIAIHEMGHSHFGLADEYANWGDCGDPEHAVYTGSDPGEPNVTATVSPLKWVSHVAGGGEPPVMPNPDPDDCDPRPSLFAEGTIGAFEGARYYRKGMYRPAFQCCMRELHQPFCSVCREAIRRVLEPFVPKRRRRRVVRS